MDLPDFSHLFNLDEVSNTINENRDPYRKEIGDRVNILDFSSCTYMNGRPLDYEFDEEMSFDFITMFIVIETGQKTVFDAYFKAYKQDLVIVNPLTNKKYRINSGHVKLK